MSRFSKCMRGVVWLSPVASQFGRVATYGFIWWGGCTGVSRRKTEQRKRINSTAIRQRSSGSARSLRNGTSVVQLYQPLNESDYPHSSSVCVCVGRGGGGGRWRGGWNSMTHSRWLIMTKVKKRESKCERVKLLMAERGVCLCETVMGDGNSSLLPTGFRLLGLSLKTVKCLSPLSTSTIINHFFHNFPSAVLICSTGFT